MFGSELLTDNWDWTEMCGVNEPNPYYTLIVNKQGQGSVSGGGSYLSGTNVSVTATADSGWYFVRWEGTISGSSNPTTIMMDGNKTVMGIFDVNPPPPSYTLNVNKQGQGSISGGGSYPSGTSVTVTAIPEADWHFVQWEGAITASSSTATTVMDNNKTVTAIFEEDPSGLPVLSVTPENQNVGASSGTTTFNVNNIGSGSMSWFAYVVAGNDWLTLKLGDESGTDNKTITVVFTENVDTNSRTGTIRIYTGDGTGGSPKEITINQAKHNSETGSLQVTLSPQKAINHGAQWSVDGGDWQNSGDTVAGLSTGSHTVTYKDISGWTKPNDATVSVEEGQTASLNASYIQLSPTKVNLTINVEGQGSVNPSSGDNDMGVELTLTASPSTGWKFDHWGGDLSGSDNPAKLTMDDDKTVTAVFVQVTDSKGNLSPTPTHKHAPTGTNENPVDISPLTGTACGSFGMVLMAAIFMLGILLTRFKA